jgi:hypothetical protein
MPASAGARAGKIRRAWHCSGKSPASYAAFPGICCGAWNPLKRWASCYSETAPAAKLPSSIRFPTHQPEISMTITAAHISPIIALIAGVLILIMPRFLNFIVAIYLIVIGLAGLGVFRMFRF